MKVAQQTITHIAASLAVLLDTAENYVEIELHDANSSQKYTLTIQRRQMKTPHQLRREAEEEVKILKSQIENLKEHFGFRDGGEFFYTCGSDCRCNCGIGVTPCSHCEKHTILK
jgi:uncharacterized membrane-anchored protein YhcB (DUF1043 family)